LIKAGARLTGKDGGDVRPPLVMLTKEDSQSLQTLIDKAAEFVR
jgi:dihydrodipicolinate synthase/N-acetylneuraminate lyase